MMDWRVDRIMFELEVLLAFLVTDVLGLEDEVEDEEDASLLLVAVFLSALIVVAEFVGVDSLVEVSEAAGAVFNFDLTFTFSFFISSSLLLSTDEFIDDDAAAFPAGWVEKNIRCS